jgi:hypothetical protein
MAKAGKNLSTLLDGLRALDLPPEIMRALTPAGMQALAAVDPAKLPGADLTRILQGLAGAQIDITRQVAEFVAKHPQYFTRPLDVLAKLDEANRHPETSTTTDTVEDKRPALERAVQGRLSKGDRPGRSATWQRFCDNVRDDCGAEAWVTRSRERSPARGYGDKSIKRIVDRLRDKRDK